MQWREKEIYWNHNTNKKVIAKFGVSLKAMPILVNKMDDRLFSVPEDKRYNTTHIYTAKLS